jgi:demethylmenaquinone methyltransferase/2-methoxy-6-polyprenyl-1,4-benzoquinol methylase
MFGGYPFLNILYPFYIMEAKTRVTPYNSEEGKKAQVERMFDNIAPRYDFLNRLLSVGIDVQWRKRAISYLKDSNPKEILDVATGTADVAIMMAKILQPKSIIGIDIAKQMLDYGRVKIKDRDLEGMIQLETGDSENLRFADNTFDAVTVAFGVRNFENLEQGLSEMHRVLRPGGRAVILEFSRPRIFPIKQLYNAYFKYVLPMIGRFTSQDPKAYSYLYESAMAFPDGDDFLNILTHTGYTSPQCERLTLGICSVYTAVKPG